jgi:glycosyltransferase involved in cell wall biosynthesis
MLPYVRSHNIPLFVVAHGKLLNNLGDLPPTVTERVQETLDAARGVFCVSDALARKAREQTTPSKVTTVPIGADPDKYPVDQQTRLRTELDIPENATVVLFVGQFTERKGIDEICEILPGLHLEETVFVFVGSGGQKETQLKQAVSESQFSARYVYTGVTSLALRRWFAVADLLLLPSHAEGRPTVIYEAMASETAVLASAVGGVPEQIVDGETGVLLPAGNIARLEHELQTLVPDRERLREMGKAGKRRLHEQDWTWADHSARVQRLHMAALDR